METGWQPIETAPRRRKALLLLWSKPPGLLRVGYFSHEYKKWVAQEHGLPIFTQPTHWHPLPQPPKG